MVRVEVRLVEVAAHTPRSLVDFDTLATECDRTAARRHAENQEESGMCVCGVDAPMLDASGLTGRWHELSVHLLRRVQVTSLP